MGPRLGGCRAALGCVTLVALGAGALALYLSLTASVRDRVYERKELSVGDIALRITAYHEKPASFALAGAIFAVEVRKGDGPWKEIHASRHDDPIPIPFKPRIATPEHFCLVSGTDLIVTVDGGRGWKIWSPQRDADAKLRADEYYWIRDVDLREDGTGILTLHSFLKEAPAVLTTRDGGLSWGP